MSIGTADVHAAVVDRWNSSGLNETFRDLWRSTESPGIELPMEYPVISDQEAPASQPFPYCVLQPSGVFIQARMSGNTNDGNKRREIRDVTVIFNIHARSVSEDDRTPKEIASFLAEEVMSVFDGHPTIGPEHLALANGQHLLTQYQTDFGVYTGEDEYQWVLDYLIRVDVPVAA